MMADKKDLPFFPPYWFQGNPLMRRQPGEVCYFHSFCEQVERDMCLFHLPEESQLREDETAAVAVEKKAAVAVALEEPLPQEVAVALEEPLPQEVAVAVVVQEPQPQEVAMALAESMVVVDVNKKTMYREEEVSDIQKKKMRKEEVVEKKSPFMEEIEMWDKRPREREWQEYSWDLWSLFQDGKPHDIPKLLSSETQKRDYLIRNDGTHVNIKDQVSGKYIVLYFGWLGDPDVLYPVIMVNLKELYKEFQKEFEVVFVALGDDRASFDAFFSEMPWLAIPFEDHAARQHFVNKFGIPPKSQPNPVLFSPQGTVLRSDADIYFQLYGVEGFPFTNEKIDEITRKEDALIRDAFRRELSLTELLGGLVVNKEGAQVPTSDLEGKVVGLYFFEATPLGRERSRTLLELWSLVKDKQHEEFEIVVIYKISIDFLSAQAEFKKDFEHVPWYSLPSDGRNLCRLFSVGFGQDCFSPSVGYFIILKPGSPTLSLGYFAFDIYGRFGIDAYPFTPERAVSITKKREQKEVLLVDLLSLSTPLRRGGDSTWHKEDITFWHLQRKNVPVILLFATHSCYESGSFLPSLKQRYLEKKGTDDYFEIIYMSMDCDKSLSSFTSCIREMPWLVHAYVPEFASALLDQLFEFSVNVPAIAAFGPDGHLVSKESNLAFKVDGNLEYPFIADLGVEVRKELIRKFRWDLERYFPGISSTN